LDQAIQKAKRIREGTEVKLKKSVREARAGLIPESVWTEKEKQAEGNRGQMTKKRKAKRNYTEPVIFVEGGIVQALLMPSDIKKTGSGYRQQSFELVDYDVFGDHEEENIFFMWEGFSARLKKYFEKRLPAEKQKFLDRIQQWQDRIDEEAKKQPKSHSADLDEYVFDEGKFRKKQ
jgi:hypothetical protein